MKSLILALLLTAGTAQADSLSVQWSVTEDGTPINYSSNGTKLIGEDLTCQLDPVENLFPGQRHQITCWYTASKKLVVDRSLHCDKQQVEDYIEIETFFFGCKTR